VQHDVLHGTVRVREDFLDHEGVKGRACRECDQRAGERECCGKDVIQKLFHGMLRRNVEARPL
jgi:hypothetical protein